MGRLSTIVLAVASVSVQTALAQRHRGAEPGQLTSVSGAICPLKHTTVNASISGFGARVDVVQTFTNPSNKPIEAIYTFPLPHDSAVDHMRIKVGDRVVEGVIKRREEARQIYEAAKNMGQTAGLLDQERPNIFTQSVANIMPGATVKVDISYVQVLKYESGQFEFTFPMVVGPRYLGNAPDPGKIAPPITPEGTRTGTTIDMNVRLDAGAPIVDMKSVLHKIRIDRVDNQRANITLAKQNEIPNRDFILHYQTATGSVQSAFVSTYDGKKGGFFNLILLPPKQPRAADISPREFIFVMDQSGSQSGFPIQKSKELTYRLLHTMRPGDTFNVYGFNTEVKSLWQTPQPLNERTVAEAHRFLDVMVANGGTNLLEGLRAALSVPKDPHRLRVVIFNTDGYVGDEANILREIKKDRDQTRIFTFGIGNGVNRFLIDAMSLEGRGDSEMVTLESSASEAADRFEQRLRTPILTDIKAVAEGITVDDMLPREIPDVFSDRPIVIQGHYENPGHGRLVVTGRVGGNAWRKDLDLHFSDNPGDSSVATLWARKKVDDLTDRSYEQQYLLEGEKPIDFRSRIVDVALKFGIMTEYTSFVAVEPRVVNVGGVNYSVHVPVEMTSGVSYEGIYGVNGTPVLTLSRTSAAFGSAAPTGGIGGGGGAGFGGGFSGRSAGRNQVVYMAKAGKMAMNRQASNHGVVSDQESVDAPISPRSYESVVDQRLRTAKGKVAVMVSLQNVDDSTLKELKKLGLTISMTDKKLRIVFGTCSATVLKKLIAVQAIERIAPIE